MPSDLLPERHLEGLWALPFELLYLSRIRSVHGLLKWVIPQLLWQSLLLLMSADLLPKRHLEGLWALSFELRYLSRIRSVYGVLKWVIPQLLWQSLLLFMPADLLPKRHLEGLWALSFFLWHLYFINILLDLLFWIFVAQFIAIMWTFSNFIFKYKISSNWLYFYCFFPNYDNNLFSTISLNIVFLTPKIIKFAFNINKHHE